MGRRRSGPTNAGHGRSGGAQEDQRTRRGSTRDHGDGVCVDRACSGRDETRRD